MKRRQRAARSLAMVAPLRSKHRSLQPAEASSGARGGFGGFWLAREGRSCGSRRSQSRHEIGVLTLEVSMF